MWSKLQNPRLSVVCSPCVTNHCGCIFTARYLTLAFSCSRFLDHTQRRAIVGRTSLDEWSLRRTDLYLTTHNNHNKQISMPPVGFEPTFSADERPKTYSLDRAATGTSWNPRLRKIITMKGDQKAVCGLRSAHFAGECVLLKPEELHLFLSSPTHACPRHGPRSTSSDG